ncbi:f5d0ee57-4b51-40cb-a494-032c30da632b [Sclerotinia trifoliorum]|uniref:F5d0ee57-4b51-40cb-a494-032c30da632b n=1 Tax=Sclerotinia trifoliorum TaxID=28548 RepID=A0A8H2VW17_9HELO|nr:f5d0ee57-4b51-40cb-a494-032c30da632b [Sclerotinia trifoliorum]
MSTETQYHDETRQLQDDDDPFDPNMIQHIDKSGNEYRIWEDEIHVEQSKPIPPLPEYVDIETILNLGREASENYDNTGLLTPSPSARSPSSSPTSFDSSNPDTEPNPSMQTQQPLNPIPIQKSPINSQYHRQSRTISPFTIITRSRITSKTTFCALNEKRKSEIAYPLPHKSSFRSSSRNYRIRKKPNKNPYSPARSRIV